MWRSDALALLLRVYADTLIISASVTQKPPSAVLILSKAELQQDRTAERTHQHDDATAQHSGKHTGFHGDFNKTAADYQLTLKPESPTVWTHNSELFSILRLSFDDARLKDFGACVHHMMKQPQRQCTVQSEVSF